MHNILSGLIVLVSMALPIGSAFAQTDPGDPQPPTAVLISEDFSPMAAAWQPVSGRWTVGNDIYVSSLASSPDLTLITSYPAILAGDPPNTVMHHEDFFVRARMRNQGFDDTHTVGLVYGYQDSQNYYEVVVSALGTVTMRTVMHGVAVNEVPPVHMNIPRTTWFDVEVRWRKGVASLKVNGSNAFTGIQQPEFTSGLIGLVIHAAVGRFDKVFVAVPYGTQDFLDLFSGGPSANFRPQSGQWAVANGTYNNSAVQQTSISVAPVNTNINQGATNEYTFRARMRNPYGGEGNKVGIVFNYRGGEYSEVVFLPTGVAQMHTINGLGAVTSITTAFYNARRNVPFEVTLQNSPRGATVIVDGVQIFTNVVRANPFGYPFGEVGFITHWAPGHFDNAQFATGIFQPCSFTFDRPPPAQWIESGTWNTTGGTLNNTSSGASDIVDFKCSGNSRGEDAGTDAVYRARLLNQYGGPGNLVGLVYNYQDASSFYAGDYFEVVFSSTGIARINKFIQGERYTVATATHTIPRNTFFNVEVERIGVFTTVKVNGATLFQLVRQGELRGGSVGVITHFAKGRFDNVSLTERVSRPPSEL